MDVGIGVDEVHDTNTVITAIARKANKVFAVQYNHSKDATF